MGAIHPMRTAQEAVAYARTQVGHGTYVLGTGDFNSGGEDNRDCAGFAICECYGLKRHRPGYNHGAWSTVEDDINCNSAIEDALHKRELFRLVDFSGSDRPEPGDLLTYPTVRVKGMDGQWKTFIGHVGILSDTSGWNGKWDSVKVIQCSGPNGNHPAITEGWASHWDGHDVIWPTKGRSVLLRRVDAGS